MMELFSGLAVYYSYAKTAVSSAMGMPEDLLHVHAGLLIFVFAALLLGRKMRSWIPIGLVFFFAILNEVVGSLASEAQTPFEPFFDVLNTVFWPSLLFLIARRGR